MTLSKCARLLKIYNEGNLSAKELAYLYLERRSLDKDPYFDMETLPAPAKDELFKLLASIKADNYKWSVFLIGGAPIPIPPEKVRSICVSLGLDP